MSYFLNTDEIVQTIRMIEQEHLDIRTARSQEIPRASFGKGFLGNGKR